MNVVSLALWGDNPLYWNGVEAIIKAHHVLYPQWQLRIHHDSGITKVPKGVMLKALENEGLVRLTYVEESRAKCRSMLWRILPIWDKEVGAVICRDADSLVTGNDRWAVEEWLGTSKIVHGINDNPAHSIPLMGGMVGFKAKQVREALGFKRWEDLLKQLGESKYHEHGADQELLNKVVWGRLKERTLVHSIGGTLQYSHCEMRKQPKRVPIEGVSEQALLESLTLVPYLGVAGFNTEKAEACMSKYLPIHIKEKLQEAQMGTIPRVSERRAVIATDWNRDYVFYLPLTVKWWARMGYKTLLIVVGDQEKWEKNEMRGWVLAQAKEQGAEIHFIPELEGHRTSTVSQVSRAFAAGLDIPETDYLITSDADMWPLSHAWFNKQDMGKELHIWYANAYGIENGVQKYPMCYTGATVATWRKIMCVGQAKIVEKMRWQLDEGLGRDASSDNSWNYDERLMSLRIFEWGGIPRGRAQLMVRGANDGRVDRSGWRVADMNRKVDAHLPRLGNNHEGWGKMRELLNALWGKEDMVWADSYYDGFKNRDEALRG